MVEKKKGFLSNEVKKNVDAMKFAIFSAKPPALKRDNWLFVRIDFCQGRVIGNKV
ncbi:hypothetical protein NBRC116600_07690 [Thalassotalea sp. SU-HH00458]